MLLEDIPTPPPGFAGTRGRVLGESALVSDHAHVVRLVEYVFSDGHAQIYAEVVERGARYEGARLVCLSAAVHALLNLSDEELWSVGNREVDWRGQSTDRTAEAL